MASAGASQSTADVLLLDQSLHFVVKTCKRLSMNPGRHSECRRPVRGSAITRRIHRPDVRYERLELRRPPQSLTPVSKQVRVRLDRDRNVRGHPIQDGRRPVQMAESVAGHIDGQSTGAERHPAAHRATTSFAKTSPGIAGILFSPGSTDSTDNSLALIGFRAIVGPPRPACPVDPAQRHRAAGNQSRCEDLTEEPHPPHDGQDRRRIAERGNLAGVKTPQCQVLIGPCKRSDEQAEEQERQPRRGRYLARGSIN